MTNLAPFPLEGLLPKDATEASKFLQKHPEFDGRRVRIGILDTGVDPAARGLDGKGKVVDIIDCSGGGDVPLTPVKPKSSASGTAEIVSPTTGRTLLVDVSAADAQSPLLVGFKAAYELWPRDLIARRRTQRRKNWDIEHARLVSQVQRELADVDGSRGEDSSAQGSGSKETLTAKKDELKARLAVLQDLVSSYSDPGPLLETVTFFDGKHWRTVVGGAEGDIRPSIQGLPDADLEQLQGQTLDLRKAPAMADFRIEHQHDLFGPADMLTYSVNHIFESPTDSQTPSAVSLVTVSGSHGTHVAGITAAHLPDSPKENGVAHGAEIVSLRIGDGRLNGMETGQALVRAAQALIATGCDIANMSFGEDGAFGLEGKGAFAAALRDYVIRQKDILFVSSAGNSAPALTTLGMPAGTTSGVFTIGAMVTAGSMQDAEYALVDRGVKDSPTTWSSRGPAADGARGTTVYSPGAAITSVPKYILTNTQLMNGTSMASPNACGCIALLLSGMKQKGIPITSERVHKAVVATAKDFGDELGVGFIQVEKAWEYLVANQERSDADFEYQVRVTPPLKPTASGNAAQRGVYLREKLETQRVSQYSVTVKPSLKDTEPERAYNFNVKCNLAPTASWVQAPQFLHLGGNGRSFEIRVDPTQLPPGLHVAAVKAYDSDKPGHELFEVPITVTKPVVPQSPTVRYATTLKGGSIERNFLAVPEGATWVEFEFRSKNHGMPGVPAKFWAHLVTLEPQRRLSAVEQAFVVALSENEPVVKKFSVKGGQTMEVCLAEMWNAAQSFDVDVKMEFHGIQVALGVSGRDETTLIGGDGLAKVECISHLRNEAIKPSISFSKRRTYVRPTSSVIRPLLSERNLHPSGKQMHELVSTYNFTLNEDSSVTPRWPTSSPLSNLYDSAVPMLTAIYEATTKKLVAFGDVYPKEKELRKGEYTVKVQWLNENPKALQALKTATMSLEQNLSKGKDVSLNVYEDHVDFFGAASPFKGGNLKLLPGERKVLNLDLNLHGDSLPKEAQPGDVLIGQFGFGPEGKYQLRYIVAPTPKKEDDDNGGGNGGDEEPQLAELLAPVAKKLKGEQKRAFLDKLVQEHPTSLAALLARLDSLDATKADEAAQALDAADAVVKQVDVQAVLLFQGEKRLPASEQSPEDKKHAKKMDERKKALVAAYVKKARACLTLEGQSGRASTTAADADADFTRAFEDARKFLGDSSDNKEWANLRIAKFLRGNAPTSSATASSLRLGQALQSVRKLIKDAGAGDSSSREELARAREQEREILAKLGWGVWVGVKDREKVLGYPKDFAPF